MSVAPTGGVGYVETLRRPKTTHILCSDQILHLPNHYHLPNEKVMPSWHKSCYYDGPLINAALDCYPQSSPTINQLARHGYYYTNVLIYQFHSIKLNILKIKRTKHRIQNLKQIGHLRTIHPIWLLLYWTKYVLFITREYIIFYFISKFFFVNFCFIFCLFCF